MQNISSTRYIDSIHLLRGIAAILVVFEHIIGREPYALFNSWFGFLDGLGALGVSAFFVISGVVLPLSLGTDASWRSFPNFLMRRFVRIEPTYLVSVLVASLLILVMTAVAPQGTLWWPSPEQLALHALYLIPFSEKEWILPVYWTLAVEFQFYLTVGLLFPLVAIAARRSIALAAILCAAFSLLALIAPLRPEIQLMKYSPCFAIGMIVAGRRLFKFNNFTTTIGGAFVLIVAWSASLSCDVILGALLAATIATIWTNPINKRLPWVVPFWWLGSVSYSLYVTHQAIASAGENIARFVLRVSPGSSGIMLANFVPLGSLAASLLMAWALYKLVEHPTYKLSRRLKREQNVCQPYQSNRVDYETI